MADGKASTTMSAAAAAAAAAVVAAAAIDAPAVRPLETPKDLKKRVAQLNKSLASVHERLIQTEKQIFDLERSYLEETRLYGNVLQGWDEYLEAKGKAPGGGPASGIKRRRKTIAITSDAAGGDASGTEGFETELLLYI